MSDYSELISPDTESDGEEKVTFPDFLLIPDGWEMGSSVVDSILQDNAATKVRVATAGHDLSCTFSFLAPATREARPT